MSKKLVIRLNNLKEKREIDPSQYTITTWRWDRIIGAAIFAILALIIFAWLLWGLLVSDSADQVVPLPTREDPSELLFLPEPEITQQDVETVKEAAVEATAETPLTGEPATQAPAEDAEQAAHTEAEINLLENDPTIELVAYMLALARHDWQDVVEHYAVTAQRELAAAEELQQDAETVADESLQEAPKAEAVSRVEESSDYQASAETDSLVSEPNLSERDADGTGDTPIDIAPAPEEEGAVSVIPELPASPVGQDEAAATEPATSEIIQDVDSDVAIISTTQPESEGPEEPTIGLANNGQSTADRKVGTPDDDPQIRISAAMERMSEAWEDNTSLSIPPGSPEPEAAEDQSPEEDVPEISKLETSDTIASEPLIPSEPVTRTPTRVTIHSNHITQAQLTTNIRNRTPVDNIQSSIDMNAEGLLRIYLFTEMQDLVGNTLYHSWYRNGKRMARVPISVRNRSARASSSKFIDRFMTGNWTVEVRDNAGTLMVTAEFDVLK